MTTELAPSCRTCQVDESCHDNPASRFWGTENPCENAHHGASDEDRPTLDDLRYVHLGTDSQLRHPGAWFNSVRRNLQGRVIMPWMLLLDDFIDCIGCTKNELKQEGYCIKLPGEPDAISITDEDEWYEFVCRLEELLQTNDQYRCRRPPPVMLVCTKEQATRYQEKGWEGAVFDELGRTPASGAAAAAAVQNPTENSPDGSDSLETLLGPFNTIQSSEPVVPSPVNRDDASDADPAAEGEELNRGVVSQLMAMMPNTGLVDDKAIWPLACQFYRHDPQNFKEGILLPGLHRRAHPYQMCDAFKGLFQYTMSEYNGFINGSEPGLGKTMETWMVYGSIVLAFMSRDQYVLDPSSHRTGSENDCALRHPMGIECFCMPLSMTRKICDVVSRAPHLVLGPAAVASQWCKSWRDWLTPTVQGPDGTCISKLPLVLITHLDGGNRFVRQDMCRNHPGEPRDGEQMLRMPQLNASHFKAAYKIKGQLPVLREMKAINSAYHNNMRATKRIGKGSIFREPNADSSTHEFFLSDLGEVVPGIEVEFREPSYTRPMLEYDRDGGLQIDADFGRERLVLICSRDSISAGRLDEDFKDKHQVDRKGKRLCDTLVVYCCFRPSTICYDEFNKAKNLGTRIMATLQDLVRMDQGTARPGRARVMLLSGTPITTGPVDLKAVLPLLSTREEVQSDLSDLQDAFNKAYKSTHDRPTDDRGDDVATWKTLAGKLLCNCMFERRHGGPFLHTLLPKLRAECTSLPPIFPPVSAGHENALNEATAAFNRLVEKYRQGSGKSGLTNADRNKIRFSNQCYRLRLFDACPGVAMLDDSLFSNLDPDAKIKAIKELPSNVGKATCTQLTLLEQLIQGDAGDAVRHGLILTISPVLSMVVYEWIRHRLPHVKVELISSTDGTRAATRPQTIKRLHDESIMRPDKPVVIVSTIELMGTGMDGLQLFMSYLVKLGEPWSWADTKQAIGRLHRPGGRLNVTIHQIFGKADGPNARLFERNTRKKDMGLDGDLLAPLL